MALPPRPPHPPLRRRQRGRSGWGRTLLPVLFGSMLAGGCVPAGQRPSGRIFPLTRHHPHDGLAVVTRPAGEGLHIWLDPDTRRPGECRPRWNPDAARLAGGDGDSPRSFGRADREEFYAVMGRGRVRWALQREFRALCRQRAPLRRFVWTEPPRSAADFRPEPLPLLEERHLLSDPKAIRRAEKLFLGLPLEPEDFEEPDPQPDLPGP